MAVEDRLAAANQVTSMPATGRTATAATGHALPLANGCSDVRALPSAREYGLATRESGFVYISEFTI